MSPILNHDHYTVVAPVGIHPGRDLKFTVDRASSWNATTLHGGDATRPTSPLPTLWTEIRAR